MLALITLIAVLNSTNSVHGTIPPAIGLGIMPVTRLVSGSPTNNIIIQDGVYVGYSNAVQVSDNQVACSVPAAITIPGSGSVVSNGVALFNQAGYFTVFFKTAQGTYSQQVYFQSNYFGGFTNFTGFNAGTLASNLNASVWNLAAGKLALQAIFSTGDGYTRSSNCWTYPLYGWSAFINGNNSLNSGYSIHLISSRWGLFAGHTTGYGLMWAGPWVAEGEDGKFYTNGVISSTSTYLSGTDVGLCEFSNIWPTNIFYRLPMFPTNFASYFGNTLVSSGIGTTMIWVRHNSDRVNAEVVTAMGLNYSETQANGFTTNCPNFWEPFATGGDSSSPFYYVMGTNLVMGFALHEAQLQGPFVSQPNIIPWLQTTIAPDTLSFVNMTGYPTFQ